MIIYGILFYKSKEGFKFNYVDESGRSWTIRKMAWTSPTYNNLLNNLLKALGQLSHEGWECFSVVSMRFRRQVYYLKKKIVDSEI